MRIMISAAGSGRGKTLTAMGLIRAISMMGASVSSFKCGPDYEDAAFARAVLGVPCRNLDAGIMGEEFVACEIASGMNSDFTIIEGDAGLYDGTDGTIRNSDYEVAEISHTPVILVIDMKNESEPVFETLRNLMSQDEEKLIQGVIYNNCKPEWFTELRITTAKYYPDLVTIGYIPVLEDMDVASDGVDNVATSNSDAIRKRVERASDVMMQTLDIGAIAEIGRKAPDMQRTEEEAKEFKVRPRIGVAYDEAFCLYYQASLENLVKAGMEIVPFSPLYDEAIPEGLDMLYLGGGYVGQFCSELEANESMRSSIRTALRTDMPWIAESNGFMYLGKEVLDADGNSHEMVGFLKGEPAENDCLIDVQSQLFISEEMTDRILRSAFRYRARRRWDSLGKPLRSLERLEEIICDVAAVQKDEDVFMAHPRLYVMCADNGVVAEGISQSGMEVTTMVALSLARGDSTVCHLAKTTGCEVVPVDIGIHDFPGHEKVWNCNLKNGTDNLAEGPAMSREEALAAIEVGELLAWKAKADGCDVILIGEMGIGNTTTSSAIASVMLDQPVEIMTGRGAGLSDSGLVRKVNTIKKSIEVNKPDRNDPVDVLAKVGGLDIAGLAGIILGADKVGIPVIIDGFITDVAALIATGINPECRRVLLPSHKSMEPACTLILEALDMDAIVTANMHLGEGGGAVSALTLLQMALRVYNSGHTFDELGVDAYTPQ